MHVESVKSKVAHDNIKPRMFNEYESTVTEHIVHASSTDVLASPQRKTHAFTHIPYQYLTTVNFCIKKSI